MTQIRIIKAYNTLSKLMNFEMPIDTARDLYFLSKKLEPIYVFGLEKEKALVEKYELKADEKGNLKFKDNETLTEFISKRDELYNLENEISITPVVISKDEDVRITAIDFANLEGFVEFK